ARRVMEMERTIIWGNDPKKPMLAVCRPFDGKPATAGNGTMVALAARDQDMVHKVYQTALEQGARDEGEPGPRSDQFYGAYFRDPEGNKLAVFCLTG
ncbi:MAG: VOC family protein, partial [Pseudomonadota bacterium]